MILAGSSPQVRGTSRIGGRRRWRPGSSPQVRGTFSRHVPCEASQWAHPRRCGEHCAEVRLPCSSPCGEGSRQRAHPRRCGEHSASAGTPHGLIPAGAGNMSRGLGDDPRGRAHPRRCGEQASRGRANVRGAHPRRCGEHTTGIIMRLPCVFGAHPRVAGNMLSRLITEQAFIPARCGEHTPCTGVMPS